jgi:hypothetical protein
MRRAPDETWPLPHETALAYRKASSRNSWRLLALFAVVLGFLGLATRESVLTAALHARGLVVGAVFAILLAGVIWMNVTLTRDCRRFGALCPRCRHQLIGPGHTLASWRRRQGRLSGQCPACLVHLEEPRSDNG